MISSYATPEGTKHFSIKHPGIRYKLLGRTNLTVSACGFGSYRVDYRVREHTDALIHAIKSGINLIDSSSNYSDGGSEILIGNVLSELINEGEISRENIVIVTKGGYIQGKNLEAARKMKEEGKGYKEVVEYAEHIWHCIHPDFLSEQITQSLERTRLETIDIYLLHNPEYFLDSKFTAELDQEELIHEYYRRIKEAFEYLETEVSRGRISSYGISSNTFVKNSDNPVFTSLERCLEIAENISSKNHFTTIQFPLNLLENDALINLNQKGDTVSVIDLAAEKNLGVLTNRPLNAIKENLIRLADFKVENEHIKLDEAQIIAEIGLLESMEDDFLKEYLPLLNISEDNRNAINYFLRAGKLLKENWKNFGSVENFNDVKKQFLIPRINYSLSTLVKSGSLSDEMKSKLDNIAKQINRLTDIMESIYGMMANTRSKKIHKKLDELGFKNYYNGKDTGELSLSAKALLLLVSVPEISCVLLGMRAGKYVDEVISVLQCPDVAEARNIISELKAEDVLY